MYTSWHAKTGLKDVPMDIPKSDLVWLMGLIYNQEGHTVGRLKIFLGTKKKNKKKLVTNTLHSDL